MTDVARKPRYPWSPDELPDWVRELAGYDQIGSQLVERAPRTPKHWEVRMSMPLDLSTYGDRVDPLVLLLGLAFGKARIEDKMIDVVRECRAQGKTWSQIGEVLGMSKQAAWEAFSSED